MTAPRRPAPGDEDPTRTVRLGQDADRTVRLGEDADRTVRLTQDADHTARPGPPDEADDATFLDPAAWATPDATRPVPAPQSVPAPRPDESPQDERPLAEGEFRRFGPGVPPAAAAVWHGGAEPERPRRRRRRLLLLVLLLAVLGLFGWRWYTPALAVTAVTAGTDPAGPSCGGAAVITATVTTNGRAGTVRYRWLRSDGTSSGELTQSVQAGSRQADLVLRWTFDGHGTLPATATVEILAPERHSAAATFTYSCP